MPDNIAYWILLVVTGGVVGWLAGVITSGCGFGIFGDIVIGVVGAAAGGWVANALELYTSSSVGAFLVSLVSAVLLVALTRLVKRV